MYLERARLKGGDLKGVDLKEGNMAGWMVGLKWGFNRTELEQTVLERAVLENASRGIHPLLRQVQPVLGFGRVSPMPRPESDRDFPYPVVFGHGKVF
jgi:hypothetical protein